MSEQEERAEFEKWVSQQGVLRLDRECYAAAWFAWQARAEIASKEVATEREQAKRSARRACQPSPTSFS